MIKSVFAVLSRKDFFDVVLICGVAGALGTINVRSRGTPLPWVAPPYEELPTTCAVPESFESSEDLERIAVVDALSRLGSDSIVFIDARNPMAYQEGHVPGAFNLPLDQAENLLGTQSLPIAPDQLVVTYCDGGACEISESLGLMLREKRVCHRVKVLEGGWLGWIAEQSPIEVSNSSQVLGGGMNELDSSGSDDSTARSSEAQRPSKLLDAPDQNPVHGHAINK